MTYTTYTTARARLVRRTAVAVAVAAAVAVVAVALVAVFLGGGHRAAARSHADVTVAACVTATVEDDPTDGVTPASMWDHLQGCVGLGQRTVTPTTPAGECVSRALNADLIRQVEQADNSAGQALIVDAVVGCEGR